MLVINMLNIFTQKIFIILFLFLSVFYFILANDTCLAARSAKNEFNDGLKVSGETSGIRNNSDVESTGISIHIGTAVKLLISVVGVIFLILAIYGGFKWMKAQGNEQEVTAARDIIVNAVIGLAIVMAAYAITAFIGIAAGGTTVIGGTTPSL